MSNEDDLSDDPDWAWLKHERLHRAAASGDIKLIESLLAEGCNINAFEQDLPLTPLHYAAMENKVDAMRCLLKAGADVNANDPDRIGNTPLAHVAESCSFEVAKLLVEAGADPTIPGWMQITALDRSARRSDSDAPKVHRLLLDAARRLSPASERGQISN